MIDLIAAEFLKMRTTRTFWWVAVLAVGLAVLVTVVTLATSTTESESDARSLISNMGIPGLFMIILGVVGAAGEYRHGTITSTFLVAPDRRRVLVAKALAYAIGGLGVGIVSAVARARDLGAVAVAARATRWDHSGLGTGDLAVIVAGALAYMAISGVLGWSWGALVTNQVTAVVAVFVAPLRGRPGRRGAGPSYGKFSLQGLGTKLSGGSGDDVGYDLFPLGVAALVYLGYARGPARGDGGDRHATGRHLTLGRPASAARRVDGSPVPFEAMASMSRAPAGRAPKRVVLAAPRGYCAGVDRAVQAVEEALDLYGPPVYVRKEIVHNKHVVEQLSGRGAVFVDQETEVPEGKLVVFSAHGVAPAVHENAASSQPADDRRDLSARDQGPRRGTEVRRAGLHDRADRPRGPRGGGGDDRRGAGEHPARADGR